MVEDYAAYGAWVSRPPTPGVEAGTMVRLTPPELNGIVGTVKWANGSGESWAVVVPYGEEGALIYVHKADVEPV